MAAKKKKYINWKAAEGRSSLTGADVELYRQNYRQNNFTTQTDYDSMLEGYKTRQEEEEYRPQLQDIVLNRLNTPSYTDSFNYGGGPPIKYTDFTKSDTDTTRSSIDSNIDLADYVLNRRPISSYNEPSFKMNIFGQDNVDLFDVSGQPEIVGGTSPYRPGDTGFTGIRSNIEKYQPKQFSGNERYMNVMDTYLKSMTPNERITYDNLYRNNPDAAIDFIRTIENDLINRKSQSQSFLGRNIQSGQRQLATQIGGLNRMLGDWTGRDTSYLDDPMRIDKEYQMGVSNANKAGGNISQFTGDVIKTVSNMLPAMALSVGSAGAGIGAMGATAAGGYYDEARNEGANVRDASIYALVGGTAEALMERLFIKQAAKLLPGSDFAKDLLKRGTANLFRNTLQVGKQVGKTMLSEGFEEAAIEPIMNITKKFTYKPDMPLKDIVNLGDMGYNGLVGMLAGGGFSAPFAPGQVVAMKNQIEENYQPIITMAQAMPENSKSYDMSLKVLEKGKNVNMADLKQVERAVKNDLRIFRNNLKEQDIRNKQIQKVTTTGDYIPEEPQLNPMNLPMDNRMPGDFVNFRNEYDIRQPGLQQFQYVGDYVPSEPIPTKNPPLYDNRQPDQFPDVGNMVEPQQQQQEKPKYDFKVGQKYNMTNKHGTSIAVITEVKTDDKGKTWIKYDNIRKGKTSTGYVSTADRFANITTPLQEQANTPNNANNENDIGKQQVRWLGTNTDLRKYIGIKFDKGFRFVDGKFTDGKNVVTKKWNKKTWDWVKQEVARLESEQDNPLNRYIKNMMNSIEKDHQRTPTQNDIDLQTKLGQDLIDAINKKDFQVLTDRLHRGNKNSLKLFSEITGKSTKTQKDTDISIRSLDPKGYDQWKKSLEDEKAKKKEEAAQKEKEEKEREKQEKYNAIGEGSITYNGSTMKFKDFVRSRFEEGYIVYKTNDYGGFEFVHQRNSKEIPVKKLSKAQRNYIKTEYNKYLEEVRKQEQQPQSQQPQYDTKQPEDKKLLKIFNEYFDKETAQKIFEDFKKNVPDQWLGNIAKERVVRGIFGRHTDDIDLMVDLYNDIKEMYQGKIQENKPTDTKGDTKDDKQDTKNNKPHNVIADKVVDLLKKGQKFSNDNLFKIADEAYGGTQSEGKYSVKDAHDAMELGVNKYLMNNQIEGRPINWMVNDKFTDNVKEHIKSMQRILDLLPTQGAKRSDEMIQYQQFSTPPSIAYIASWLANLNENDVVLEPSAGVGGLATFAKQAQNDAFDLLPKVYVNELSKRRLALLKELPFDGFYNEDAEQIDNVLPEKIKPTVVIMNPPFSSAVRMRDKKATKNATRHIEQALRRLEPGGRLIAIVGNGMSDSAPSFKKWWSEIKGKYNVRANIGIDGSNYRKYGTTFDIQMVIIDKTGPTSNTITTTFKDLTEIPKALEDIRNDRQTKQQTTIKDGEGTSQETRPGNTVPQTGNDGGNKPGDRGQQTTSTRNGTSNSNNGSTRDTKPTEGIQPTDTTTRGEGNNTRSDEGKDKRGQTNTTSSNNGGQPSTTQPISDVGRLELSDKVNDVIENEDDVYSKYRPRKVNIKGAKPHVSDLVESAAMAAVEPPDVNYVPNLPKNLIDSGSLTSAQLEPITYAGQAHSQTLSDGKRKGFFIGDGTGVGKGREIAGIILDNFRQGRKKAVWISNNPKLLKDAKRDWKGLGQNENDLLDIRKVKIDDSIKNDKGIMYASYASMRSKSRNGNATRLTQLTQWLGKDFDGVIVFDESHNMGNMMETGSGLAKKKPSQQALVGIDLQNELPKARIVYASATGATSVHNLGYLTRLGLWGEGTAFSDVKDFVSKISSGGLAAMEMVARDMKSLGVYLARSLSYKGVEYDTLTHELNPMQQEIYDTLARGWQKILQNVEEVLISTEASGRAKANARAQFGSSMQRFFNQIITSMSMPSVIKDIKKQIENGNSVVIQLVNTNEAAANRELVKAQENNTSLEDIDLTPTETMIEYLKKSFPIYQYEEYVDENGNTRRRVVTDSQGNPVISREAVRRRDELIEEVKQMRVPDGPLEILFDTFGVDKVAEVTGRTKRIVPKIDERTGRPKRIVERMTDNTKIADAQSFQDGKKRILVFSDAGGTGQSYHADKNEKNQEKRVHYLLQPGWNASKASQGFGRTHRSNQKQPPKFVLVTTNVMGQKRFTSSITKRLDQLGALTKGQRETGSGMFSQQDNLESPLARRSLRQFYRRLDKDVIKRLGLGDKLLDEYGNFHDDPTITEDTNKFLNRVIALEVDEQNEVFNDFYNLHLDNYNKALEDGEVDLGLENYIADKIDIIQEETIREDETNGSKTQYVQLKAYEKPKILTWNYLNDNFYLRNNNFEGFVKVDDADVRMVMRTRDVTKSDGSVVKAYTLQSPMSGVYSTFIETTMEKRTKEIPKKEWKAAWQEEIEKQPEHITNTLHMLTGTLLPVWNKLPTGNTRVMRVITSDGKTLLGRLISPKDIDSVLSRFSINREVENITNEDIMKRILENGETAYLENDRTSLTRRRVSNEYRIEIISNNGWFYGRMDGVITETINSDRRYFIPTGEKGIAVLERILKDNPLNRITKMSAGKNTYESQAVPSLLKKRMKPGDKKTITRRSDIEKFITEMVDIPVGKGKFRNKAIGIYKTQPKVIRLKKTKDLDTLFHETGHFLDQKLSLMSYKFTNELRNLGQVTSLPSYTVDEVLAEGVAEFTRYYLVDNNEAQKQAPNFYAYFESKINKDNNIKEMLKVLKVAVDNYVQQSPLNRVLSNVSIGHTYKSNDKLMEKFCSAIVEDITAINRVVTEMTGGKKERKKLSTENAYDQAILYRGIQGRAEAILKDGVRDKNYNKISRGFEDILKPVKKHIKEFRAYAIAKRGLELADRNIETGLDIDDLKTIIRDYKNFVIPKTNKGFDEILLELVDFQDAILREELGATGIINNDTYKAMKKLNADYIPFYRVIDTINQSGTGKGYQAFSPIKGIKGSTRDIIDPLESIVKNVYVMTQLAAKNNVVKSLASLASKNEGSGKFIDKVPTPTKGQTFELSEIEKALEAAGADIDNINLESLATIFRPTQYGKKDKIITVFAGGKPQYYEVFDDGLYKALLAMDKETTNFAIELASIPAKTLRAGATLNPEFATRNPLRDMFTATIYSKYWFVPVFDTLRGLAHVIGKTDSYYKWMYAGGANADMTSTDRESVQASLRKMVQGYTKEYMKQQSLLGKAKFIGKAAVNLPLTPLQYFSKITEEATRLGEFVSGVNQEMRKTGRNQRESIRRAALASRDVTLDFARFGTNTKALNKIIAFLNAQIQDIDKMARSFKSSPAPWIKSMILITLPSILLYLRNRDDEEYQKRPQWEKDTFWHIKLGPDNWIIVPKPFGLGFLFGTLPERMFGYIDRDDPKALDGLAERFKETFTPDFIPTALLPWIENTTNYKWFKDQALIPSSETGLEPPEQYGKGTSEFAKTMGSLLFYSPRKIDNIITGYGGGLGKYGTDIIDTLALGENKFNTTTNIPVYKAFRPNPYIQAEEISNFYDNRRELQSKIDSAKKRGEEKDDTDTVLMSVFTSATLKFSEFRKLKNYYNTQKDKEGIAQVDDAMNKISKELNKAYEVKDIDKAYEAKSKMLEIISEFYEDDNVYDIMKKK